MPGHTARSLFDQNITSAEDCLALYDAVEKPTFIFDLRHPFPGTVEAAERLFDRFGIITPHLSADAWNQAVEQSRTLQFSHYGDSHNPQGHAISLTRNYELTEGMRQAGQTTVNRLHTLQVTFSIQWTLPVSEALALERVEVKRKAKNLITKIELYLYRRQPGEMREASLP